MSILVVQVLPNGIILGADRNITEMSYRSDSDGKSVLIVHGQSQRPKVLRWPNRKALVGYVGAAQIGGIPADEWLYDYIGDHFHFPNFQSLAGDLTQAVQVQRTLDEAENGPEHLVIHIAGFEKRDGYDVPVIYYIRNHHGHNDPKGNFYTDIRKEFLCNEEFWNYFPNMLPSQIKADLERRAREYHPFWFHQGYDLGTFNTLDLFMHGAFSMLCNSHPNHLFPHTLREWEQHLRMSILVYGAYFQAFKGPGEQYVGGGADAVSLAWPD